MELGLALCLVVTMTLSVGNAHGIRLGGLERLLFTSPMSSRGSAVEKDAYVEIERVVTLPNHDAGGPSPSLGKNELVSRRARIPETPGTHPIPETPDGISDVGTQQLHFLESPDPYRIPETPEGVSRVGTKLHFPETPDPLYRIPETPEGVSRIGTKLHFPESPGPYRIPETPEGASHVGTKLHFLETPYPYGIPEASEGGSPEDENIQFSKISNELRIRETQDQTEDGGLEAIKNAIPGGPNPLHNVRSPPKNDGFEAMKRVVPGGPNPEEPPSMMN